MKSAPSNRRVVLGWRLVLAAIWLLPWLPVDGTGGETLYNGIELPDVWPPANGSPKKYEPMSVPYLEAPPAVVPIDVGRQLFVDDFLIENTTLTRVFHAAQDYPGNPLLTPSTRQEMTRSEEEGPQEGVVYLGHGGVFYDPPEKMFKMWYTAGWRGALALAESRDGLRWQRPALDSQGSNVILPAGLEAAGWDNAVWLDLEAANPAERIKFLTQRSGSAHSLQVSADNKTWSGEVPTGKSGDYCSFFYNPFRRVWVHSIKRDGPNGRTRYYSESPKFLERNIYDRSVYWVGADKFDAPDPDIGDKAQLYSLNGVAYESLILGMFYIHLGPSNRVAGQGRYPKLTELKLGFSRDGFHWDRPDRSAFIHASRKAHTWNRGYLHSTNGVCLVVGDWLYFPYTAYSGESPRGWRGMYSGASVGMALLRRDGFASMEADAVGGTLTTRPVRFSGRQLFVNVDCPAGELRVEILDEGGRVIEGFDKEACLPIAVDRTLWAVNWRSGSDLSELAGRPVSFRFHLTNGRLYSFWVSQDKSGASRGYVAAGGPGFDAITDTSGIAAYREAAALRPPRLSTLSPKTP